jgi:RNA polymerase sigma-70 factor (ECF subfamily)
MRLNAEGGQGNWVMSETSGSAAPQVLTDEDLVLEVLSGDEAAFELLYQRYFKRIYRFVDKRLSNSADVEETVQEVFINAFSSLSNYRREAPFSSWVLGLTRRTIASRFKRKRHPTVPLFAEEGSEEREVRDTPVSRDATPLEHYECRERLQTLEAQARELTPEQWQLFELHHLEERSIAELSTALRKSPDSIKSNLYRARKILLAG